MTLEIESSAKSEFPGGAINPSRSLSFKVRKVSTAMKSRYFVITMTGLLIGLSSCLFSLEMNSRVKQDFFRRLGQIEREIKIAGNASSETSRLEHELRQVNEQILIANQGRSAILFTLIGFVAGVGAFSYQAGRRKGAEPSALLSNQM